MSLMGHLRSVLGFASVAVKTRLLKKTNWQRHGPSSKPSEVQVDRELQSEGNKGWMPFDRHKWPLFEPDNDLCTQEEQAQVATQMISCQSRLLQLILGD